MAWSCYFEYASTEVINSRRTEVYAAHEPWFNPAWDSDAVERIFGDTYVDAASDPAPWYDPDDPDTGQFYGAYPLSITGFEDSPRTSTPQESTGPGGTAGTLRIANRSIVFECALLGASECAVEKGMAWLRKALTADSCDTDNCSSGADVCYFACEPCATSGCETNSITGCDDENRRTLRAVVFNAGPTITARRKMSNGGVMWVVTFTGVTGKPWELGPEEVLVEGFGSGSDPWVPSTVPADWLYDDVGVSFEDVDCSVQVYDPLVDPLCPAVEAPPAPPLIPLACWESPEGWVRRWFTIPRKYVPYWGDVIPNLSVRTTTEVRGLRIRFYSDLDADGSALDDPCSFCGDMVITYIPEFYEFVVDGSDQTVMAIGPGDIHRRADTLVISDDGTPYDWPTLTCGLGYVVSVDVPEDFDGDFPLIDLSLTPRIAA